MVKGKAPCTGKQPGKKPVVTNARQVTVSSPAALPSRGKQQKQSGVIPSCCGCGVIITDDVKALQCDRCQAPDTWKCVDCLNLPKDMYDHLIADDSCCLRWFCESCDKQAMDLTQKVEGQSSEKLDNLITLVEKLLDKLASAEDAIKNKCDVSDMMRLEDKIQRIEERVMMNEKELEPRLVVLEEQVKSSSAVLHTEKDNAVSDEELIKVVVQEEINRKTAEERDQENRKRNIIIYRVPEKRMENVTERKASDAVFVKDLLDGVFNSKLEDQDIERMYRLGQFTEGKTRPLLVVFRNGELKDHIMSNLSNLKQTVDKFKGISLAHDLSPREREERKQLVERAKQEHVATSTDDVENYKFLVVGKGERRRIIKLKKNNH